MAKTEIKSKEAKIKAAMAGGKGKKKKWGKGKVREKLQNAVLFDQKVLDRVYAEIPKMKVITIAALSERFKLGGTLARATLRELLENKAIRVVAPHSKSGVYTRAE